MKVAVADMVLVLVASSCELRVSGNDQQLWSHHHIHIRVLDQRSEIRAVAATALIFLLPQRILILADNSIILLPQSFHIADCSHRNTSTATFLSPTSWALSMRLPSLSSLPLLILHTAPVSESILYPITLSAIISINLLWTLELVSHHTPSCPLKTHLRP